MEAHENSSSDDTWPLLEHIQISAPYYCLLISRYIFTAHLYTVHIKNYVAFVEKEKQSVSVTV